MTSKPELNFKILKILKIKRITKMLRRKLSKFKKIYKQNIYEKNYSKTFEKMV